MPVALWFGSVAQALAEAGEPQHWLSPDEQRRAAATARALRRDQFIAGRWCLRRLLAAVVGGTAAEWCLDASADSAPAVRSGPLRFDGRLSLSHSQDHVLAALADGPVGVDIESSSHPGRDRAGWQSFVLTQAEQQSCRTVAADEWPARLLAHWAAKEAFGKARGTGLPLDALQRIEALPAEHEADTWIGIGRAQVVAVHTPQALPALRWYAGEDEAWVWSPWRVRACPAG